MTKIRSTVVSLWIALALMFLCYGLLNYRDQTLKKISNSSVLATNKQYSKRYKGIVIIPTLDIKQNIYGQSDKEALNKGAEQLNNYGYQTTLGKGNLVLAAHNYNDNEHGFSRLQQNTNQDSPYLVNGKCNSDDWLNGTEILVVNADKIYTYIVDGQVTVRSNDTSVLAQKNKQELNLITCLFPSDQYRIVTHANQTASYTWEQAPQSLKNQVVGR